VIAVGRTSVLVEVSSFVVVGRTSASGSVSAPFVLVPSDGLFGRFDLAALRGCNTLNVWFFLLSLNPKLVLS
jgi:hypothetical protein